MSPQNKPDCARSNQEEPIAGLVSAGLAIALAPASVARISLPGMVHRPLTTAVRSRIMLFWRFGEAETVVANFVALATATMPQPGAVL